MVKRTIYRLHIKTIYVQGIKLKTNIYDIDKYSFAPCSCCSGTFNRYSRARHSYTILFLFDFSRWDVRENNIVFHKCVFRSKTRNERSPVNSCENERCGIFFSFIREFFFFLIYLYFVRKMEKNFIFFLFLFLHCVASPCNSR